MKTLITLILSIFSLISFAQEQKEIKKTTITFNANGACEMCKARIEKALDVTGVKFAEWNIQSHDCKVIYDPRKITELQIHQLVADVGHDTDKIKAKDEVYNSLHGCCLYNRKP